MLLKASTIHVRAGLAPQRTVWSETGLEPAQRSRRRWHGAMRPPKDIGVPAPRGKVADGCRLSLLVVLYSINNQCFLLCSVFSVQSSGRIALGRMGCAACGSAWHHAPTFCVDSISILIQFLRSSLLDVAEADVRHLIRFFKQCCPARVLQGSGCGSNVPLASEDERATSSTLLVDSSSCALCRFYPSFFATPGGRP